MQVSSNGRVHRTQEEWREVVTRFAKSTLGRREFCRQEKINRNSFDRWHKRLTKSGRSDFVDVTPGRESSASWAVEVELADGTIVRVGS
jgi:hypothetical protein